MKEDNRKEILTRDIIKKEAKIQYLNNKKFLIIFLAVLIITEGLFMLSFELFDIEIILLLIGLLVCFGVSVFRLLDTLTKINAGQIKIAKDILVSCEEGKTTSITSVTRPVGSAFFSLFGHESQFRLNFKCYGTYTIPKGKHYEFSQMYCMEEKGVYNYSVVNDEFYVVTVDKGKILLVYNTKLFELQE